MARSKYVGPNALQQKMTRSYQAPLWYRHYGYPHYFQAASSHPAKSSNRHVYNSAFSMLPKPTSRSSIRLYSTLIKKEKPLILLQGKQYKKSADGKSIKLNVTPTSYSGSKSAVKADMSDSATVLKSLQQKVDRVEYKKSSDGNKLVKVVRVNPVSLAKQKVKLSIHKMRNRNAVKKNELCIFYTRFGRCTDGDQCKYMHDPAKIAVCRKFLKGLCTEKSCPLSHKVDREKMPVCIHYLKGICSNDPCPYRHVKVNPDAKACPAFLKVDFVLLMF
eukprot:TRINITY_DN1361_c0_g1_i6.p1 TRINITY_DN1361_c0_g1~~TRINITY_DN1361_c0_g1_i6.p1  ORF type:complete len:275 (+),score=48.87 TRINITY_DN1361_c0_g1_i6:426-1250(+)